MIVAMDGPAGSGKTTVAKLLSKRLNFSYLDTGATYRALTLQALKEGFDLEDGDTLAKLAGEINLKIDKDKIFLYGFDVSKDIRTPLIDKNISAVVTHPQVRLIMVDLQRKVAKGDNFVVEGRDITTVVFPKAEFKFYVDADFSVRAQRRYKELLAKGIEIDFEEVAKDLKRRDEADINRKVGALKKADDAMYIDTTKLTIEGVVEMLAKIVEEKLKL